MRDLGLLAALGVPLWLVVGALLGGLWSRRAVKRASGVFAAKVRLVSETSPGMKATWPRRPLYARWVHDVLILHQGLALVRNRALPVASATAAPPDQGEITRLGDHPHVIGLQLDDGAIVALAFGSADQAAAVGPFYTAPSTG